MIFLRARRNQYFGWDITRHDRTQCPTGAFATYQVGSAERSNQYGRRELEAEMLQDAGIHPSDWADQTHNTPLIDYTYYDAANGPDC